MKLLVTGSDGLVGSAIIKQNNIFNIIPINRSYDLRLPEVVNSIFNYYKPDYVIHTAAKVGGVGGNQLFPYDYYYDNILMNTYIINNCIKYNIKNLFVFSSVCAFPDNIPILKENLLHEGPPSKFNTEYAYAKRMVDIQLEACKKQYNINYTSIIPVNIFGENDNYNLDSGHVIPSLIHKFYIAKKENKTVCIWGNGSALREFIYSQDIASILLELITTQTPSKLILSNSVEYSIKEIVEKLSNIVEYKNIYWDNTKPNGQIKRPSDTTLLKTLIKFDYSNIDTALTNSYKWFIDNYPKVRL